MTKKKIKRNRRGTSRAMALRSSEPKLQEQRSSFGPIRRKRGDSSSRNMQAGSSRSFPAWSPWDLAVAQQNLWLSSVSSVLRIQQQLARVWLGGDTSRANSRRAKRTPYDQAGRL